MTDMPELRIFVASPALALCTVAACVVNAALNAPSAVARSVIFCSCAALPASTALFLVWRLVTAVCIAASGRESLSPDISGIDRDAEIREYKAMFVLNDAESGICAPWHSAFLNYYERRRNRFSGVYA